jgi:hypothetical protein
MVKRNTTFNLPGDLIQRAKSYAAEQGTTLTTIVRRHLERVTGYKPASDAGDALAAFSKGRIGKQQAIEAAGVRDYAQLLVALGDRGLDLPRLPAHEEQEMTATFMALWGPAAELRS